MHGFFFFCFFFLRAGGGGGGGLDMKGQKNDVVNQSINQLYLNTVNGSASGFQTCRVRITKYKS